jgi:hypothetical protein
MTESYPEINPTLFEEAHDRELVEAILTQTGRFVKAKELTERQNPPLSPGEQTVGGFLGSGQTQLMTRDEAGEETVLNMVGASAMDMSSDKPGEPVTISLEGLAAEMEIQARTDLEESANFLVSCVVGYQAHASQELTVIYGDSPIVPEKSWEVTWIKLRDAVSSADSGHLIADFFDELAALRYPRTFDRTDWIRGPEFRNDVTARTFYKVMKDHLTRQTHDGFGDSWSR